MPRPPDADAQHDAEAGPVPPGNAPGHHPEAEQDKPRRRPPRPRPPASEPEDGGRQRFEFAFAGPAGVVAAAFTMGGRAYVDIEDGVLTVRYGPWSVSSPLTNVSDVSITGPYRLWKVAGPPHISLRDRGISFATSTERGVCIRFREPVRGLEPTGTIRHPGVTVTVADPEGLVAALAA